VHPDGSLVIYFFSRKKSWPDLTRSARSSPDFDKILERKAGISARPTVELQLVSFHEEVSGLLSSSLANVIKAGLDKMIPLHTPVYQPGNFQKILITPNQILFFCFGFLALTARSS